MNSTTSDYKRPDLLLRETAPPLVVYLDMNHWIGLAKATKRRRDGDQHREVLDSAVAARKAGRVEFPLSGTHYAELAHITHPRQRSDVAQVMEQLSGFTTLASRTVVMRAEIEATLDELVGPRPHPLSPVPLLGTGAAWAFGFGGSLRVVSGDGADVTTSTREEWKDGPAAFDRLVAAARFQLERSLLRGPRDDQLQELRATGYRPESAMAVAERRALQEREQARRLDGDPVWRKGRTRDVISAREIIIELEDALNDALYARGRSLADLKWTRDAARRFIDCMPSSDVSVTLKTAAHRNRDKSWTVNDIHDIDALSVAVPYCDVVVTEKYAHRVLTAAHIDRRYGTTVLRRLHDLPSLL